MSTEIKSRYASLAETSCCLSCGGALSHAKAQPGEKGLDLGSGRGNDVIRLAEQVGKEGFVWGLDLTPAMIEKARKTATRFNVTNVDFLLASLESIPLEDNSINVIISNCTLNHAQNKDKVWQEIFRVLAPAGRFIVSDIYSKTIIPAKYANDPAAVAECWAGSVTRDQYFDTLEKTGFKNITTIEESDFYPKGSVEVASITLSGTKPTV